MIGELEKTLGNTYAILLNEFQRPYLVIKMFHLKKQNKKLPDLIKDPNIKLTITTGIEALGRNSEIQKLDVWLEKMSMIAQPAQALNLNIQELGQRYANGLGLNIDGLIKPPQQVQQEEQQAQQAQTEQAVAPELIKQGGQMMQQAQDLEQSKGEVENGSK